MSNNSLVMTMANTDSLSAPVTACEICFKNEPDQPNLQIITSLMLPNDFNHILCKTSTNPSTNYDGITIRTQCQTEDDGRLWLEAFCMSSSTMWLLLENIRQDRSTNVFKCVYRCIVDQQDQLGSLDQSITELTNFTCKAQLTIILQKIDEPSDCHLPFYPMIIHFSNTHRHSHVLALSSLSRQIHSFNRPLEDAGELTNHCVQVQVESIKRPYSYQDVYHVAVEERASKHKKKTEGKRPAYEMNKTPGGKHGAMNGNYVAVEKSGKKDKMKKDKSRKRDELTGEGRRKKVELNGDGSRKKVELNGDGRRKKDGLNGDGRRKKVELNGDGRRKKDGLNGDGRRKKDELNGNRSRKKVELNREGSRKKVGMNGEGRRKKVEMNGEGRRKKVELNGYHMAMDERRKKVELNGEQRCKKEKLDSRKKKQKVRDKGTETCSATHRNDNRTNACDKAAADATFPGGRVADSDGQLAGDNNNQESRKSEVKVDEGLLRRLRAKFQDLFRNHHSASTALAVHVHDLEARHGQYWQRTQHCPSADWCQTLYDATDCPSVDCATGLAGLLEGVDSCRLQPLPGGGYVACVVTPLMRRNREMNLCGAEVNHLTTLDVGGSQPGHSLLVMCNSPIGCLPLALLLTSADTTCHLVAAFTLYKSLIAVAPSVWMTPDSSPLQTAVRQVFPGSHVWLSGYHVLQDSWLFILDKGNGIPETHQVCLYQIVQNLLFSSSELDLVYRLKVGMSLAPPTSPHFAGLLNGLYDRRKEWSSIYWDAQLHEVVTMGGCVQLVRECFLRRLNGFSPLQLVHFLLTRGDAHHARRLRGVAGRDPVGPLPVWADCPIAPQQIDHLSNHVYLVKSSGGHTEYSVNDTVSGCSCASGSTGRVCAHQRAVSFYHGTTQLVDVDLTDEQCELVNAIASDDHLGQVDPIDESIPETAVSVVIAAETVNACVANISRVLTESYLEHPELFDLAIVKFEEMLRGKTRRDLAYALSSGDFTRESESEVKADVETVSKALREQVVLVRPCSVVLTRIDVGEYLNAAMEVVKRRVGRPPKKEIHRGLGGKMSKKLFIKNHGFELGESSPDRPVGYTHTEVLVVDLPEVVTLCS